MRGVEPDADARLLSDVLWSDPTERDELEGIQPNARGRNVVKFGPDRVRDFCAANGLQLILRAHQCVQDGFEYFAEGRLITLFSAPDYGAQHQNDGAMLVISRELHVFAKVLRSKGRHASRHCWLHDPDRPVSPLRSRGWVPSSGGDTADESAEAFEALDGEVVELHVHELAGVVHLAGAADEEVVEEELDQEDGGAEWERGSPVMPPAGVRSVLEMAMAARSSGGGWTLQLPD
jgi:diadenosine tetraphosphatase ApaH/serine/threonine PP2A family protein phosphatase